MIRKSADINITPADLFNKYFFNSLQYLLTNRQLSETGYFITNNLLQFISTDTTHKISLVV